ncbi:hypothetical protein [Rhizobium sp. Root1220]|uniref:hypothetical protein n=1 Tax=Rhizobium sp. Root1220 TaxID=1736432 RepID=UPI0006FE3022|nr:hypothetical protein [Rhizobium sp. Root1220]KQV84428.1 hypothetical protein ASC90_02655 [Rhizobium sp. Root1220]
MIIVHVAVAAILSMGIPFAIAREIKRKCRLEGDDPRGGDNLLIVGATVAGMFAAVLYLSRHMTLDDM